MASPAIPQESSQLSPSDTLREMIGGAKVTQLVYVAAKLGIADLLADGPKTTEELAASAEAHPPSLHRLLRALVSLGIFTEGDDGRFELTPLAEPLRTGVPDSVRAMAIGWGEEVFWRPWGELLYSVRTGKTSVDHLFGEGLFDYLASHGDAARIFDEFMAEGTSGISAAVVEAYDFSGVAKIVDVGGGRGGLVATILEANPEMKGVLFDLPSVVKGADQVVQAKGVARRCEVVSGDFFQSVPAGGDAYILKWIIHDWDDDRAQAILKNCRAAIGADGRLLLVERVLPPRDAPSSVAIGDVTMLVLTGGRERTKAEYAELLRRSGFRLTTIVPTATELSVIEGVPV